MNNRAPRDGRQRTVDFLGDRGKDGFRGFLQALRRCAGETVAVSPISIHMDESIDTACSVLIENEISGLPVVDGTGVLIGIITEKDLLSLMYDLHTDAVSLEHYATQDVVSVTADQSLVDAVDVFETRSLRWLMSRLDRRVQFLPKFTQLLHALTYKTIASLKKTPVGKWARTPDLVANAFHLPDTIGRSRRESSSTEVGVLRRDLPNDKTDRRTV
ncbi:MAG TPA: CBS domain-containing protein [Planctomycetes bacterium]|nr:CBS domain-containing protein [Planctomycetota bacterium]